ncbi:Uncharacterized protein Rs2_10664 [Raphanus sativus]|nr:Uncharacterized protein Rs2_10664 [Raphanus sativus]
MLHIGRLSEFVEFPASREFDGRARPVCFFSLPSEVFSFLFAVGAFVCWIFLFLELEPTSCFGLSCTLRDPGGRPGFLFPVVSVCSSTPFCVVGGPSLREIGILSSVCSRSGGKSATVCSGSSVLLSIGGPSLRVAGILSPDGSVSGGKFFPALSVSIKAAFAAMRIADSSIFSAANCILSRRAALSVGSAT